MAQETVVSATKQSPLAPGRPPSIDATRLQRVPSDMIQFGFLPRKDASFKVSSIVYAGNLASTASSDGAVSTDG